MKDKKELIYTHSRLQIEGATVFLAVNETENIVEQKYPVLILDNERHNEETTKAISVKTYDILKECFESLHGEKLPNVKVDKLDVSNCQPILELEDKGSFVSLIEYIEENNKKFLMVLTSKGDCGEHAIHISEEAYNSLLEENNK